jgi:uncharacterized protein YbcV (DUF1398 family)
VNADQILKAAQATLSGSLPFPEIVGLLISNEVENYQVDFLSKSLRFYSVNGSSVITPLAFEDLPSVAQDFDGTALREAIIDSQQHGQKFRIFCQRAINAGVQSYFVFLRGQRVTYFGRQGDQHTEWFPGAKPSDS